MGEPSYIAVDLGAGSGRVFLAALDDTGLRLEEVRRFQYPPCEVDRHLRWNLPFMYEEIRAGLTDAGRRARERGSTIASIGIDSWAVDYGLVDEAGTLLENPICYRDTRTAGMMDAVFAAVPRDEVVGRTGIQCLSFNTLYQLAAHVREGLDSRAARLLLIPDLLHSFLTGRVVAEYTNATTTQMVSAATGTWDLELCERIGLPARLLPAIVPAGTDLGPVRAEIGQAPGLEGVHVVAPATHDTGSAVAGAPLRDGWAYISSGTWSLVGLERSSPLIDADVARGNFTNEGGAYGTVRFLKNVMGLWILESCRREWRVAGHDLPWPELVSAAAALPETPAVIDPDDERLFNPPAMLPAIAAQLAETRQSCPEAPAAVARVVLDSLAFRYASILRDIGRVTGVPVRGVHIVGGGSLNEHLNQATADTTGLPVVAGPVESTVLGNAAVQAIAAGRFASLARAREYIAGRVPLREYTPRQTRARSRAAQRYAEIEGRRTASGERRG